MTARLIHSLPTWLFNKRPNNGKFGGGNPGLGKTRVTERCAAIKRLSDGLLREKVIREPILTSFHTLHELRTEVRGLKDHNLAGTMTLDRLIKGIKEGRFPRVNALTAPAFGPRAGVHERCILSNRELDVSDAMWLHSEVQETAALLKKEGAGEGRAIWWPAFDALPIDDIPATMTVSNELIPRSREWGRIVDFWVAVLKNGGAVHIEYKHGDPGLDIVCTVQLAILLCQEVNKRLGRTAMLVNIEFAHALGTGETVARSMKMIIGAGLFDGFCHGNSGQRSAVRFHDLLQKPIHPLQLPILMDWDFILGYGSPDVVEDQRNTFILLRQWSQVNDQPVICEHDIHYFSREPFANAAQSIKAAEEMWAA